MDRIELRAIAEAIKEEALESDFSGPVLYPLKRDILWSEHGYPESDRGVEISHSVEYPITYQQALEFSIDEIERLIADKYYAALRKMAVEIEESRMEAFGPRIVH
ncbi:hypothetical protein [Ruegeria sp. HKCCSP335]|uniref:hypothetical protein n=1 Tax=Ruegeria sp. HKCCSP335 TaxID=2794833 RepID=UPI001AE9A0B2|nr:hypothetical protein [Ruegeria sp. HKCCSP335]